MRPSTKELYNKLRKARTAVAGGRLAIIHQEALVSDALELGYFIETELGDVIAELLDEASPAHYAGSKPPQRSYEHDIKDLELLAFEVESRRFQCRVYFKFALAVEVLWLISLHQSRSTVEER